MSCENNRKYIAGQNDPGIAELPAVPQSSDAWIQLKNFLTAVKAAIEGASTNPITPRAIQNFTTEETDAGIILSWDPDPNTQFYVVYRHSSNEFSQANIIAGFYAPSGSQRPAYFDVAGQDEVSSGRVYWIRGYGPTGAPGPLSVQTVTVDSGIIPGDRPWTEVLTPGMVRLVEENNADPVNIRSFGTAPPTLGFYRSRGTSEAPSGVLEGDEIGHIHFGVRDDNGLFVDGIHIHADAAADVTSGTSFTESFQQLGGDSINGSWDSTAGGGNGFSQISGLLVVGDDVFVGVSRGLLGSVSVSGAKIWRYSISGDTWTDITPAAEANADRITNIVHLDGKIYYGTRRGASNGNVYSYDIAGESTSSLSLSRRVQCVALDAVSRRLYAGNLGDGATLSYYDIDSPGWTNVGTVDLAFGFDTGIDWIVPKDGNVYLEAHRYQSGSANSRIYRHNGVSFGLIGGEAASGNLGTKSRFPSAVSFAAYIYVTTSDGEVWEWNEDTDEWTKIGGDGVNSSWTYTNTCGGMFVYGDLVYAGVRNGSSAPELWEFTYDPQEGSAGTWAKVADSPDAGYDDFVSIGIDDNTNVYAGMGSTAGADADFWGVGTASGVSNVQINLAIEIAMGGTPTQVIGWYSNGDIGLGIGDAVFWDESTQVLSSPILGLDDTGGDHKLLLQSSEDLTANRTLSIDLNDADRALTVAGDATISGTNTGDVTLAGTPDYITISGQVITRGLIDLAADVTGDLPYANLTAAGAASKLLGRGDSGAGDWQEITLGTGLTMTGTTLSAAGGAVSVDEGLTGDGSVGDPLSVLVDGVTIIINGSNELEATGSGGAHASTHYDGEADEVDITQLGGYSADADDVLHGDGTWSPPAGGGWELAGTTATTGTTSTGSWDYTSNVTEVVFTDLDGYSEIMVLARQITKGTSGVTVLVVSIDNGSNFLTSSGDYIRISAAGVEGSFSGLAFHGTNATAARTGFITIKGWDLTAPKMFKEDVRNVTDTTVGYIPTANALNALKITLSGGGNITGGSIRVFGR